MVVLNVGAPGGRYSVVRIRELAIPISCTVQIPSLQINEQALFKSSKNLPLRRPEGESIHKKMKKTKQ